MVLLATMQVWLNGDNRCFDSVQQHVISSAWID
jgi:hypothetical protein